MAFTTTKSDLKFLKSLQSTFLETIKMISVSKGFYGDCALLVTHSGELYAVGKSSKGCLEDVTETEEPRQLQGITGVAGVSVCGSIGDALAYTKEGKVYAWGQNVQCKRPTVITGLTDIVDARCVHGHYLALSKTGKVYEWRGESCSGLPTLSRTPKLRSIEEVVVAIACGCDHSLALTENGDVYQWGEIWSHGWWVIQSISSKVNIPGETVAKVTCNGCQSLVLTKTGKIFTWGMNGYGLGDLSGCTESDTPVQVGKDIRSRFVDIGVNSCYTCAAVTEAGEVYMWGKGENDETVEKPKLTELKELHQVFAKYKYTRFSWTCSSNDKITSDSCACIAEKSNESRLKHEDLVTAQVNLRRLELEYNKQQEKLEKIEKDYQQEQVEKMRVIVEHKKQLGELDRLRAVEVDNAKLQAEIERLSIVEVDYKTQLKELESLKAIEIENVKKQQDIEKLREIVVEHTNQLGELDRLRAVEVDIAKLQGEIERLRVIEVDYKTQLEVLESLKAIEVDNVKMRQEFEKLREIVVEDKKQLGELDRLRAVEVDNAKLQGEIERLRVIEVENKTQLEKLENLKAIEVDNVRKQQDIEKLRDIVVQYTKQLEELENPRSNEVEYVKQQEKLQKLEKENHNQQEELEWLRSILLHQK